MGLNVFNYRFRLEDDQDILSFTQCRKLTCRLAVCGLSEAFNGSLSALSHKPRQFDID